MIPRFQNQYKIEHISEISLNKEIFHECKNFSLRHMSTININQLETFLSTEKAVLAYIPFHMGFT